LANLHRRQCKIQKSERKKKKKKRKKIYTKREREELDGLDGEEVAEEVALEVDKVVPQLRLGRAVGLEVP
jgi:hypothetical protein